MKDTTKNKIALHNSPTDTSPKPSGKTIKARSLRGGGNNEKKDHYRLLQVILLILNVFPCLLNGQATRGPVIPDFGAVYEIRPVDFPADPEHVYRVIFDITRGEADPASLNQSLNTIARFLNMHARAGVPVENLQAVAVIHSTATHSILTDKAYRKRYGTENPNLTLLGALRAAGVELFVCGQSLHARAVAREEVAEPVKVALSAMTVLIQKQNEGYGLIGW